MSAQDLSPDDLLAAVTNETVAALAENAPSSQKGPMLRLIEDLAKRCVAYGTTALDPKRAAVAKPHYEMALQNAVTLAMYCDRVMRQSLVVVAITDDFILRGTEIARLKRILDEEE